ncbi:MAG: hypothetical protein ACI9MR_000036 [Myxococcota bacterium]|jgi:hypothetical protein
MRALLALDVATKTGFAVYVGRRLMRVGVIRPLGAKGNWTRETWAKDGAETVAKFTLADTWPSSPGVGAWRTFPGGMDIETETVREACIMHGPSTVRSAEICGRVDGIIECLTGETPAKISPSSWRRIIMESWNTGPWPAGRPAKKAKAAAICVERLGLPDGLPDDVYDAALIGAAHLLSTGVGQDVTGWAV